MAKELQKAVGLPEDEEAFGTRSVRDAIQRKIAYLQHLDPNERDQESIAYLERARDDFDVALRHFENPAVEEPRNLGKFQALLQIPKEQPEKYLAQQREALGQQEESKQSNIDFESDIYENMTEAEKSVLELLSKIEEMRVLGFPDDLSSDAIARLTYLSGENLHNKLKEAEEQVQKVQKERNNNKDHSKNLLQNASGGDFKITPELQALWDAEDRKKEEEKSLKAIYLSEQEDILFAQQIQEKEQLLVKEGGGIKRTFADKASEAANILAAKEEEANKERFMKIFKQMKTPFTNTQQNDLDHLIRPLVEVNKEGLEG